MKRFQGIEDIVSYIENEIVVCNIGFPSRELYKIKDRVKNFYMIGSMGLASSIGLGIAMSTDETVIVFDGDGSILMNLGSLVTIYNQNPKNLILIVFDNGCYGSTGNQHTYAQNTNLLDLAKSIGFDSYDYDNIHDFKDILNNKQDKPIFIHYKISPGNSDSPIIDLKPETIKKRFMEAIK